MAAYFEHDSLGRFTVGRNAALRRYDLHEQSDRVTGARIDRRASLRSNPCAASSLSIRDNAGAGKRAADWLTGQGDVTPDSDPLACAETIESGAPALGDE